MRVDCRGCTEAGPVLKDELQIEKKGVGRGEGIPKKLLGENLL